jgi:hypothetical protein
MKKTLFAIPVIALMIGCGSVEITDIPTSNDIQLDSAEHPEASIIPVLDEAVESKYAYDADFEVFKQAVKNKDIQGVSAFASSDAIDAEEVLMYFEDPVFLDKLMAMTYDDLTVTDEEGVISLVCSVNVTGDAGEDGELFESAVILYFTQGDSSLELDMVMTAG